MFNRTLVEKVMPDDSIYISILREPGSLFESTFDYFYYAVPEFQYVPHRHPNSVEMWLDKADRFFSPKYTSKFGIFAKNHVMFDFGYNASMTNDTEIANAIQEIDKRFDFILISDYLDQSLVLLAEMLHCPLAEVTSVVLNGRDEKPSDGEKKKIIREKVKKWNKADAALFDYFNKSLWKRIEKYGEGKMKIQVEKLRVMNKNQTDFCINGTEAKLYSELQNVPWKDDKLYQPKGVKIKGFDLKAGAEKLEWCLNLIAPEPYMNKKVHMQMRMRTVKQQLHRPSQKLW